MRVKDAEFLTLFHQMTEEQQRRFLIAATGTDADFEQMITSPGSEKERFRLQRVREISKEARACADT